MPGQTLIDEIESTFVTLGFDWYRDFKELQDNTAYRALVYLDAENDFVEAIEVRGGAGEDTYDKNVAWQPYAIARILDRLGQPEEVYVYYPFRFDPGGLQAYRLFIYYPIQGVAIYYLGKAGLIEERPQWARACPNILETDEINLFLFQPDKAPDYLERTMPESSLSFIPLAENEDVYEIVSWEQATETTLEHFDWLFTNNSEGSICFDFKTYWTGN